MQVFISWSGPRGLIVAEALKVWLTTTLQALEPFLSKNIDKGSRGAFEIAEQLEKAVAGIVCVTKDSLHKDWLLYEAGALSKLREAHVCTFLLDLKPSEVEAPLSQFQHTVAEKDDVRKLLETLNKKLGEAREKALDETTLRELFELTWPKLHTKLEEAKSIPTEVTPPTRTTHAILEEIVEVVRGQDARLRLLVREASNQSQERILRQAALLRPEATSPYANLGQNTLGSLAGYGTVAPFPPNNPNLASNVIVLSPSASASPSPSDESEGEDEDE